MPNIYQIVPPVYKSHSYRTPMAVKVYRQSFITG